MPDANRDELLLSIANRIADYREGEVKPPIDASHVNRWVLQFAEDDQLTILQEMKLILSRLYLSRNTAKALLTKRFSSRQLWGDDPVSTLTQLKFLRIQDKGNSQKDVLELVDEILQSLYGLSIEYCGKSPKSNIYIDDCLFSGNRVLYDLKEWIPNAIPETTLCIGFFAVHTAGLRYVRSRLEPLAQKKKVIIKYIWFLDFHNITWETKRYDCLWNCEIAGDTDIDSYIQDMKARCEEKGHKPRLFRPRGVPLEESYFSSASARRTVEKAFLKAGLYIISLSKNPKPEMRPMGYEKLESLGFGSIFVTYRNIANNCPLALWWGDPEASPESPLSKWYPLFPRKSNEQSFFESLPGAEFDWDISL